MRSILGTSVHVIIFLALGLFLFRCGGSADTSQNIAITGVACTSDGKAVTVTGTASGGVDQTINIAPTVNNGLSNSSSYRGSCGDWEDQTVYNAGVGFQCVRRSNHQPSISWSGSFLIDGAPNSVLFTAKLTSDGTTTTIASNQTTKNMTGSAPGTCLINSRD